MFSAFHIQPVAQIYVILNMSQNRLVDKANGNRLDDQGSVQFQIEAGNFLCFCNKVILSHNYLV
jgi:hypothetical protein